MSHRTFTGVQDLLSTASGARDIAHGARKQSAKKTRPAGDACFLASRQIFMPPSFRTNLAAAREQGWAAPYVKASAAQTDSSWFLVRCRTGLSKSQMCNRCNLLHIWFTSVALQPRSSQSVPLSEAEAAPGDHPTCPVAWKQELLCLPGSQCKCRHFCFSPCCDWACYRLFI